MDDELIVMKAELQRKVVELENATCDISNLLASTIRRLNQSLGIFEDVMEFVR